jgi:hypothetical protein
MKRNPKSNANEKINNITCGYLEQKTCQFPDQLYV